MTQSDYMILVGILFMGGAYVWKEKAKEPKEQPIPLPPSSDDSN